ncbi:MAG: MBG domain-containing protein [Bifidobacterium sp.]
MNQKNQDVPVWKRGRRNPVQYMALFVSIAMFFGCFAMNPSAYAAPIDDAKEALRAELIAQCKSSIAFDDPSIAESVCTQIVETSLDSLSRLDEASAKQLVKELAQTVGSYLNDIVSKVVSGDVALDDVDDEVKQSISSLIDQVGERVGNIAYDAAFDSLYASRMVSARTDSHGAEHTDAYWTAYDDAYDDLLAGFESDEGLAAAEQALSTAQTALTAATATLAIYQTVVGPEGLISGIANGSAVYSNGQIADAGLNAALKALQATKNDLANFDNNKVAAQQAVTDAQQAFDSAKTAQTQAEQAVTDKGWTLASCALFVGANRNAVECKNYRNAVSSTATATATLGARQATLATYSDTARDIKQGAFDLAVGAAQGVAQTAVNEAQNALGAPSSGGSPATGLYEALEDAQAVVNDKKSTAEQKAVAAAELLGEAAEALLKASAVAAATGAKSVVSSAVKSVLNGAAQTIYDEVEKIAAQISTAIDTAVDAATTEAQRQLTAINAEVARIKAELERIEAQVNAGADSARQQYEALRAQLQDLVEEARSIISSGISELDPADLNTIEDLQNAVAKFQKEVKCALDYVKTAEFKAALQKEIKDFLNNEPSTAQGCATMSAILATLIDKVGAASSSSNIGQTIQQSVVKALEALKAKLDATCAILTSESKLEVYADEIPASNAKTYDGQPASYVATGITVQSVKHGHVHTISDGYTLKYAAVQAGNATEPAADTDWVDTQQALKLVNAGTYTVFIQAGYKGQTAVSSVRFTIGKRVVTVKPVGGEKKYGEADSVSFTYVVSKGTVVGDDDLGISFSRESGENVGSYKFIVDASASNRNYSIVVSATARFTITNNAAIQAVIDAINALAENPTSIDDADAVAEATNMYDELTDGEKAQIEQPIMDTLENRQDGVAAINMTTDIARVDVSTSALPWNVRLVVVAETVSVHADRFSALSQDGRELKGVFDIYLKDTLTGEKYELDDGQSATIAIRNAELAALKGGKVIHEKSDGGFEELESDFDADSGLLHLTTSSFSYFAVTASAATVDDERTEGASDKVAEKEHSVAPKASTVENKASKVMSLAKTGVATAVILYAIIAFSVCGASLLAAQKMKKE